MTIDLGIDLDKARRDTPGIDHVAHLNNAGGALRPSVVTDTVVAHLRREAEIGPYEAEAESADRVAAVYGSVARLVHAQPDEIALVQSATAAWNVAFSSIPLAQGQRILTARTEYISNAIALLQACERTGATLEIIEDDEHGQVDLDQLERRLDDDVALVALTHIPTGGGVVNPAAEVGALTRRARRPVPARRVPVGRPARRRRRRRSAATCSPPPAASSCAAPAAPASSTRPAPSPSAWSRRSSASARPPGRRRRPGRSSRAPCGSRRGSGRSPTTSASARRRTTRSRSGCPRSRSGSRRSRTGSARTLAQTLGVTVRDKGVRRSGIVTFTVDGMRADDVRARVAAAGVNVSVTRISSAQLDYGVRGLTEVVRASPHYYTSDDELDRLLAALR